MPAPTNTLIVEGSFEELADELATYLDGLASAQEQSTSVQSEIQPLLQDEGKREDVLKKIVTASSVLSSAPEREFIAAYNQLVHLIRQAPKPDMFLPKLCSNLSNPVTSSPHNSLGLQLSILTTIFNTLPPTSESRYHIFLAILSVVRKSTQSFDLLRPQLKTLDLWLQNWDIDQEDSRKLYLAISDVASDAGDDTQSYAYLLRALRTLQDAEEVSTPEAQKLSLKALSHALGNPTTYDFSDLTALDSIQALHKSDAEWFELLEIFSTETLEDYDEFVSSHTDFLNSSGLNRSVLETKMRLLTLSSLAASASQTRSLPYATIAKALKIPAEEVERSVIDVIRAGLVEGKLSQSTQTFLIHRATYRVFGEHQWREVAARLDLWKRSLENVLRVLGEQKREFIAEKEREAKGEGEPRGFERSAGRGGRGGYRGERRERVQQEAVEVE
ncbi:hypothetical protein B9Z65_7257 [Elsinoe australis]|uniref:Eukaryotic translation initiation factor 3 subunit M n=1 Tax=Elsinoe australis TaxID=40998 RepID=A0A2P7Z6B7_9PEZI|nr:hypothetical protein B9Z65_7257 [Elsinoe australis]